MGAPVGAESRVQPLRRRPALERREVYRCPALRARITVLRGRFVAVAAWAPWDVRRSARMLGWVMRREGAVCCDLAVVGHSRSPSGASLPQQHSTY